MHRTNTCVNCGKDVAFWRKICPRCLLKVAVKFFISANSQMLQRAKESGAVLFVHNKVKLKMLPNKFSPHVFLHLQWPPCPSQRCRFFAAEQWRVSPQQQQSKLMWSLTAQRHFSHVQVSTCWIQLQVICSWAAATLPRCLTNSADDQKTDYLALCLLLWAKM